MSNLSSRMAKLERANGAGLRPVTAIAVHFFEPGINGPIDGGAGIITVIGGEQFSRCDFETAEDFFAAVDECYRRVHGRPYPREDEQ